jgi:hypothetical protein
MVLFPGTRLHYACVDTMNINVHVGYKLHVAATIQILYHRALLGIFLPKLNLILVLSDIVIQYCCSGRLHTQRHHDVLPLSRSPASFIVV